MSGHTLQGGPVELDVLAGGEVPVAAVVAHGDRGEHPQLRRGQDAVGIATLSIGANRWT